MLKMKITVPTKFSHSQKLPIVFNSLLHSRAGNDVQKLQFPKMLQIRRDVRGVCGNSIAWSSEKCNKAYVETVKMSLVRPATEDYEEEAIESVKDEKVIAVPTDTLYGFACDACSLGAVHRIYQIKGREYTKPLAICVGDVQEIQRFAMTDHLPQGLLHSLLPGPVTVVLRRGESSILEKSFNPGLESVGVRVPDSNFIRAVARGSGSALALTSANLSGNPSSVDVKDFQNLWRHCEHVYDGGSLPTGRAGSTVVDLTVLGKYRIVRPGSAMNETVAILERHALLADRSADKIC